MMESVSLMVTGKATVVGANTTIIGTATVTAIFATATTTIIATRRALAAQHSGASQDKKVKAQQDERPVIQNADIAE